MRSTRVKKKGATKRRRMTGGSMGKVYVFYHIFCNAHTLPIVKDQSLRIIFSNLYKRADAIYCFLVGEQAKIDEVEGLIKNLGKKFIVAAKGPGDTTYERFTLLQIPKYIKPEDKFLYIHSKGVSKINGIGDEAVYWWRTWLEYGLMSRHEECLEKLNEYDVVGVNYSEKQIGKHFSGNFWWATGKYYLTLPNKISYDEAKGYTEPSKGYNEPEKYILSGPNVKYLDIDAKRLPENIGLYKINFYPTKYLDGGIMSGGNAGPMITIFILCFNEERIIEFTIKAYRNLFPNCKIVIYDNESTDNSVKKAKALDCEVRSFSSGNILDELLLTKMRNSVWKNATTPWVIICDMDEIITANQNDLVEEDKKGTTILKTSGYEMYGKSGKDDLSNIKINSLINAHKSGGYSKTICFRQDRIQEINFSAGAHTSQPVAKPGFNIKFSKREYPLYHYKKLGSAYYSYTQHRATPRSINMKKKGMSTHYTTNVKINETTINTNNKVNMEKVLPLTTYYIPKN